MVKKLLAWTMVVGLGFVGPLWAQGGVADERSAQAPAFDEPEGVNSAQKATMNIGSGKRKLNQARKLDAKIDAESDAGKRSKLEAKQEKLYKGAVQSFREGLSYNPKSIEAWAGLGSAYRSLGQLQEALAAHVEGMKVDATDQTNFVGWTETAMDGLLFGQVTNAHGQFAQDNPAFATVMLEVVERWYQERQAEPGDLNPADLERLGAWIEEQKQ